MEFVSIIIPTHNRLKWLGEAVDSVIAQTHSNWELIIVDDGSTEDIAGFIQSTYPDTDIRVLRNEQTTSPGAARNRGVALSKGDYLSFLDSDDLWYPHKLTAQLNVFREFDDGNLGFVGAGCDYMDADGKPTQKPTMPPKQARFEDFVFKIKMPGSGSNNLIKRSAFESVGGFRDDLQRAEDKQLWLNLLRRYSVAYADDVVATIRLHGTVRINVNESITLRNRLSVDDEIEDSNLRRKARAYTYFVVFTRQWMWKKLDALRLLTMSFLIYPFAIAPGIERLKGAARIFKKSLLG